MSITIKSGAKVLYQWERGVALTASTPCDILRISREDDRVTDDLYPVISGSTGTAMIRDRMLTESGYLHISRIDHADGSERVLETVRILVRHAPKPQNTASSTKEIGDMQALRMQMAALERAAREGKFDGKDGITPHIGENGNWWLGETDTGVPATGDDGITPHIGGNGNWYIGDTDTGVKATGEDGITPHVGENGNWRLGEVDTGVPATGADGYTPKKNVDYFDGEDGITPHIGANGNWYIGDVDTGVLARGLLDLPSIGANGNWFIGGVDTGIAASGGGVTEITSDMVTDALGYTPVTPEQLQKTGETATAAQTAATAAQTAATAAQTAAGAAQTAAGEAKTLAEGVAEEVANKAPAYTYGTEDLTAGTSPLETGKLHFVYE